MLKRIAKWLVFVFRIFMGALTGFLGTYYSKKYAALVRRLGLPRGASSSQRGFIIVQIDGLSCKHLQRAIERGQMPYMRRLINRRGYVLRRWDCGLPCTTPAVQGGIMFGDRYDIPAFRWYDKAATMPVVTTTPSVAYRIQARLARQGQGILRGGSSFMNMFDGGANLSMFTLGALNRKRFFESVRGLGFLLLFILNPFRSIKMLFLVVWEHLVDLWENALARFRKQRVRPLSRVFPFLRAASNVILREIQTFCVILDVYRGVPAIYTTYYGYDEVAHHYGSTSKSSLRALHAIDQRIKEIDGMRRLALNREYDLYILSDHGMVDAEPFSEVYGQSLGRTVRDILDQKTSVGEADIWAWDALPGAAYLREELEAIEENLSPPIAYIPRRLRWMLIRQMRATDRKPTRKSFDEQDVVVLSSGSMAHLYLNAQEKQLDIGEVAAFAPRLATRLLAHPGIWLVAGRHHRDVMIMGEKGMVIVNDGLQVEGENPLSILADPQRAARELAQLIRYPHAGDLVVMGRYDADKERVCCFERLWASHGGLGGPQTDAFLVASENLVPDFNDVVGPEGLHAMFWKRYTGCE